MPSTSRPQQKLMYLALNEPDKVKKKNRSVLSMSKDQLQEFLTLRPKKKNA